MATLKSINNGVFSASTTWGLVDPISFNNSTNNQGLTATLGSSASFIPGAITVQGLALKIFGVITGATTTFNAQLFNVTTSTSVENITISANTLPPSALVSNFGWYYYKFSGAPYTLTAGQSYSIRMSAASAGQVNMFRGASLNDWCRALITTTNQAPAAGDYLLVAGEYSNAQPSGSAITVTINGHTSGTPLNGLSVSAKGVLNVDTSASTSMRLTGASNNIISTGGLFEIGNSGSTWAPDVTSTLLLSPNVVGAQMLQVYGGTFNVFGPPVTTSAILLNDIGSGAISARTNVSTNWPIGSNIIFPSSTTNAVDTEFKSITAATVGNVIRFQPTINTHSGAVAIDNSVQLDLINLTRRVVISGNITNRSYISINGSNLINTGNANLNYVEIKEMGGNSSGSNDAILMLNGGVLNLTNSSMWFSTASSTLFGGVGIWSSTISASTFISGCTIYGTAMGVRDAHVTTAIEGIIRDSFFVRNTNGILQNVQNMTGIYLDNTFIGNGTTGLALNPSTNPSRFDITISGFSAYAGNGFAIVLGTGLNTILSISNLVFDKWRVWKNSVAFQLYGNILGRNSSITFNNVYSWGNTNNFSVSSVGKYIFQNSYFWAGPPTSTQFGISWQTSFINYLDTMYFNNTRFGINPTGGTSSFTTAIFNVSYPNQLNVVLSNCSFSGTESAYGGLTGLGVAGNYSSLGYTSLNHNLVNGQNKLFTAAGTISTDTAYFSGSSPSLRYSPTILTTTLNTPNPKLRTNLFKVAVNNGQTCTVSASVRKSAAPDTVYNGAQPRLMYAYNPAAGNFSETVGATATAASNGAWEVLTYTTPTITSTTVLEFYVDCDGNAGFMNVDNFSSSTTNNTAGTAYWSPTGPYIDLGASSSSAPTSSAATVAYTFIT